MDGIRDLVQVKHKLSCKDEDTSRQLEGKEGVCHSRHQPSAEGKQHQEQVRNFHIPCGNEMGVPDRTIHGVEVGTQLLLVEGIQVIGGPQAAGQPLSLHKGFLPRGHTSSCILPQSFMYACILYFVKEPAVLE